MTTTICLAALVPGIRNRLLARALFCLVGLLSSPPTLSSDAAVSGGQSGAPDGAWRQEPLSSGWTVQFDNDALNGSRRDFDYTAGIAITLSGRRVPELPLSANRLLAWLDHRVGVHRFEGPETQVQGHALQFGLVAFTPARLESPGPVSGDRPYANLLYTTSSRFSKSANEQIAYQTHLTIGLLGTRVAELFQKGVHKIIGATPPRGYSFQISNGGEPTARYAVSRQVLIHQATVRGNRLEVAHSAEAAVGFLTEATMSLFGRWGDIYTPWWSFSPDRGHYISQPRPAADSRLSSGSASERYVWIEATLRARLYNAFLQGQFRDSTVVFSRQNLKTLIPEFSIGISTTLRGRWELAYSIRYQGREVHSGPAARSVIWASVRLRRN